MPFVTPKLADYQISNFKRGLAAARTWAQANNKDVRKVQERLAFAAWTESRGQNLCNNGDAFAKITEWSEKLTPEKRKIMRYILRTSMILPNDGEGDNGGSTGWLQQLSNTYVMEMFGKKWGYGTIAETMNIEKSSVMFMDRLVITNLVTYRPADHEPFNLSDPVARDVLTVQRPLYREAISSNYNENQVSIAKWLVDQFGGSTVPVPDPVVIVEQWVSKRILKK